MKKFSIGFICGFLVMANHTRKFLVGENLVQGMINYIKEEVK